MINLTEKRNDRSAILAIQTRNVSKSDTTATLLSELSQGCQAWPQIGSD